MQTECSAERSMFGRVEGRAVVAEFDGGALTSDAGGLLLGAADRRLGLVRRIARCFRDARDPRLVEHSVATLIGQRVFGIALGYEDLNDHDELRHDPLMAVLAGKLEARREDCAPVAGKSTLNRLELSRETPTKYRKIAHEPAAIEALFVDLLLEAHDRPPQQIILDLDATDDPLHGHQEGRFFHGYYDCYCYLPLYVFCGRHLLAAKLRPSNIDASAGSVEEVARIVAQIRRRWPRTRRDYQEFRVWPERFESVHAIARVKRSPNRMANWALASDHSRAGMFHSFSDRFKTRYSNFIAASSVGKCPLARTARGVLSSAPR